MDSRRSDKSKKKKAVTKTRVLLIALAVVLAIVGIAGGYIIGLLNKMDRVNLNKESLGANNELTDQYSYIKNIALFGVDDENGIGRSDSMMIATIDTKNKKLKVTSLMRDSYVDIPEHGGDKLNSSYAYGQEALAIKTINQNFDLNIEEFVTVDFKTLPKIIDEVGGIDIEIKADEIKGFNEVLNNMSDSGFINSAGVHRLDGIQAMAYCRVRATQGDDFRRTERQRTVIDAILKKMLKKSPTSYPGILNEVFPMVKTNLTVGEILDMGTDVVSIGNNLEQSRFPTDADYKDETIRGMSCLTFDKDITKQKMHDWIFEDIQP